MAKEEIWGKYVKRQVCLKCNICNYYSHLIEYHWLCCPECGSDDVKEKAVKILWEVTSYGQLVRLVIPEEQKPIDFSIADTIGGE